jgi:hypothetical protein
MGWAGKRWSSWPASQELRGKEFRPNWQSDPKETFVTVKNFKDTKNNDDKNEKKFTKTLKHKLLVIK